MIEKGLALLKDKKTWVALLACAVVALGGLLLTNNGTKTVEEGSLGQASTGHKINSLDGQDVRVSTDEGQLNKPADAKAIEGLDNLDLSEDKE